jgi:hypothetical protein
VRLGNDAAVRDNRQVSGSRTPSAREQEAIELLRAQLNRREHRPEELIERRSRHAGLVAAMRAELAAVRTLRPADADDR